MADTWVRIAVYYGIGLLVLAIDIFVPSHFLLSVLGLCLLGCGLYEAFQINAMVGAMNAIVLLVLIPTGLLIGIRNWHRTPIGRLISPPNPELTEADRLPLATLQVLVGQMGRTVTLLRPVGTCEFAGRRVECKAETGLIQPGATVEAVGLSDRTVVVRLLPENRTPTT